MEIVRLVMLRDHIDSFTLDDPKPGLAEFREIGGMVIAKAHSFVRRSLRNSAVDKMREANRIKGIVHSSEQILFVCSGNICRSPFAEYYARAVLPRVFTIRSCGFIEEENRSSPYQAIEIAKNWDVDLTKHKSVLIRDHLVEDSDIIFIFEEKHFEKFQSYFPDEIHKVFYLGDLNKDCSYEIEDPYGGDENRFRSIYTEISHALEKLRVHP